MIRVDPVGTGVNIKNMMKQKGLTVKDIQQACGFATVQAIYKWFRGDAMPAIDNMVIIADLFNCKIDDIVKCLD